MSLFVGFEVNSGREVRIPIFHMLVTGQTQLSGKTTALKTLAKQVAEKGYKIIVLDSKTNIQDYEGFGQEIPVCLKQTLDSMVLRDLLESINQRKITPMQATLLRILEGAKTFEDLVENATKLGEKSRSGFVQDACLVLSNLVQRLIIQTKQHPSTSELTLPYKINRMTINDFELQGQQLIAKTVFEEVLMKYQKVIVILDESSKFLPQKYSSACSRAVQLYVTQGAATNDFLWEGTQFLATTSKDSMKVMGVKLLGRQDHDTECQHTIDLIPDEKIKDAQIMGLKLGQFMLVSEQTVRKVYVCPDYADKTQCLEVALGRRDAKKLDYLVPISAEMLKELQKKKPTVDIDKLDEHVRMPPVSEKTVTVHVPKVEKATLKPVVPERKRLKPKYFPSEARVPMNERFELLENNVESLRLKLNDLMKILKEADKPMQVVQVQQNGKTVPVNLKQVIYNVKAENIIKHFQLNTDSNNGKVMWLAKEGFFNDWRTANDVLNALVEKRWAIPRGSIYSTLNFLAKKGFLGVTENSKKEDVWALPENVKFIE